MTMAGRVSFTHGEPPPVSVAAPKPFPTMVLVVAIESPPEPETLAVIVAAPVVLSGEDVEAIANTLKETLAPAVVAELVRRLSE